MSQRGKRQASRLDDGPVATKRRKARCATAAMAEEEEAPLEVWTPRPNSDLKISAIYNRNASEAPAELFRKDLISAMKLPDSEPLTADEYWVITDQWKQEWEKGVQVPVNPDSLPRATVTVVSQASSIRHHHDFRLPKSKYIKITKNEEFKPDEHYLSPIPSKAEKVCSYDLDNCDLAWLKIINGERASMGHHPIREDQLERVIEELEIRCWDKVQNQIKSVEGLGIEFDENVICDVCRSPDSEEGNEMVFCDSCNICVHQACYGITAIPPGQWLCRTCAAGQRPECVLCPNKGGAMKCTRSGHKWAHVSCALWIPEVSIGCVEKMEPITKISSIPQSRWALICVLCRERVGACIQCSVKTCKVAYHVTCAFKHGLEMRAIIEDENADDGVKLRSYCEKHSVTPKKDHCGSTSEDDDCKRKKRKDMTSEEKNQARAAKLAEIEAEFERHVSANDVSCVHHDVDQETAISIYNYWVMKRRSGNNKPLLAPPSHHDAADFLTSHQEQADLDKMKMFVQLRQDLERVRNLCYMVSRREKLSRTFFRMREQTFHKQIAVLSESSYSLSSAELTSVKEANHGPSIYDRLYSHKDAPELSTDFETVLARIAGVSSPTPEEKIRTDRNGMRKRMSENPYKKMYVNGGLERRRNIYTSMSSGSEPDIKRLDSQSSDGSAINSKKGKRLKKRIVSRVSNDTSTEDEDKWGTRRNKSLRQMEKELGDRSITDDSDDILTFTHNRRPAANIYSDSDSDSSHKEDRNDTSHAVRTKAAVKEFTAINKKKSGRKSPGKPNCQQPLIVAADSSMDDDYYREKDNSHVSKKAKDSAASDLIVPQRQAAKKATESIRTAHSKKIDPNLTEQEIRKSASPVEDKPKSKPIKVKSKDTLSKENKYVKEEKFKSSTNDIYDFDKDYDQDILSYVPQRQAAKKAAEHIKSGLHKPVAENELDPTKPKVPEQVKVKREETVKVGSRKEVESEKNKKIMKPQELKGRKTPKTSVSSSSSSSSSSSCSGSTSSSSSSSSESANEEEDEEEEDKKVPTKAPLDKKTLFDPPVPAKEEKKVKVVEKKQPPPKRFEISSFLEKGKHSVHSSSTSSTSESEESSTKVVQKKTEVLKSKAPLKHGENKTVESRKDDTFSKVAANKKLRKTPEKKLKTSDGRPELEFQQPPTQREESSSREKSGRKGKSSAPTSDKCAVSSQAKESINKIECPPKERSASSGRKSHSRQESEKGDTQSKKDNSQGRKRKPDDLEKISPIRDRKTTTAKPEGVTAGVEEISRSQYSPAASGKTDKKVGSISPCKKSESHALTSVLEREIAERKAGRDAVAKNTSKKSLDRLFEKRDKLVKEHQKRERSKEVYKSPNLTITKSPEKGTLETISKEKELLTDENKNDKIEEKTWAKLNTNSEFIKEEQKRPPSPEKPKHVPRSLFSPVPETFTEKKEDEGVSDKSVYNNNQMTSADLNLQVKLSLPVLSPTNIQDDPYKQMVAEPLPQLDKLDTLNFPGPCKLENETLSFPSAAEVECINIETKKVRSRTSSLSAGPPTYHQRSIFSPQPPSKDSAVAALFDFENDILAVDDTVNEDSFNIARDSQENAPPVSFSFNNDFLFKLDSKEDNARETLNLVQKLRRGYAKKSHSDVNEDDINEPHSIQPPLTPTVEEESSQADEQPPTLEHIKTPPKMEIKLENSLTEEPIQLIAPTIPEEIKQNTELLNEHKTLDVDVMEHTMNMIKPIMDEAVMRMSAEQHLLQQVGPSEKHEMPSYDNNDHYYPTYGLPLDVGKVPGREKLDRSNSAQADERWVPPSSIPPSVHSYDPVPSPYRNKWADSEIMPSRHSETSSVSSTSSSEQREEMEQPKHDDMIMPPPNTAPPIMAPDLLPFQGLHTGMPYNPSCQLGNPAQFHFQDPGFAVGAVSIFQPTNCSQIPFSTGPPPIFQPNFSAPYTSQHPLVNKPSEEPSLHMPPPPPSCSAAFTASSHNMAITAGLVSPSQTMQDPSLTPLPFPPDPCQQVVTHPVESPAQNTDIYNHQPPPSVSSEEPATPKPPGKKSPSKPTRTSARFIAQQGKSPAQQGKSPAQMGKSPAKSPGKSPRQLAARGGKEGGKRGRPPGRGGQRGRGRGRARGRGHSMHSDTIHSKLVGTVYDFDFDDDEERDSLENLRAMRERRKSSDVHEKKDYFTKDCSQSPNLTSPKNRSYNDLRDLRPPSPTIRSDGRAVVEAPRVDIVQPLLPGPVDMRTYSSYDHSTTSGNSYHNHIIDHYVPPSNNEPIKDYVEELEEEIQTLKSVNVAKPLEEPSLTTISEDSSNKQDSRNQLKVKIKGPFLDANYASAPGPVVPRPAINNISQTEPPTTISCGVSSTGTSNLRRMRKKELLRQYWTQDMNMDETISNVTPAVPPQDPLVSRNVITIPKAVASMTSIPTREDYKAVVDANMEKKRKGREKGNYDNSDVERRKSITSNTSIDTSTPVVKRRGRAANKTVPISTTAPKLKIKIGGADTGNQLSVSTLSNNDDRKNLRVRPPKKRITTGNSGGGSLSIGPTVEELKRESMKFRKMVMADFNEEDKVVESGSKKRKRCRHSVQVIADEATKKLIIRIKRPEESAPAPPLPPPPRPSSQVPPAHSDDKRSSPERTSECISSSAGDKNNMRTCKTTPIKLKISRCEEGYVMKPSVIINSGVSDSDNTSKKSVNKVISGDANKQPINTPPPTIPLSKDCEVR